MDNLELAKKKLLELVNHSRKYHDGGQKYVNAYKNAYMLLVYIENGWDLDELILDNCHIKHANGDPIDLEFYNAVAK